MKMSRSKLGPKIDRLIAAGDVMADRLDRDGARPEERMAARLWDAACDDLNLLEPSEREEPGEAQSAPTATRTSNQGAVLSGPSASSHVSGYCPHRLADDPTHRCQGEAA